MISLPKIHIMPSSHYVLLSLLFFIGLELISAFHKWIIIFSLILLGLLIYGIILVTIEEKGKFHPVQSILPVLAAAGLIGFSLFLPATPTIHLYFLLASLTFFWLLKHGAKQAYPTWNWMIATIIYFIDMAVILGLRFHLYLPVIYTLGLILIISFLISLQSLHRTAAPKSSSLLLALCLGLALTQLSWLLLFLPLHFLSQSGILVIFYYILFHLLNLSFERRLTRHDIFEYIGLGLIALLILLTTTRWL